MLTMWCLEEVVLLGKQVLFPMPMDLLSGVTMLLLELKERWSKSGFGFSVSEVVTWVGWLNLRGGVILLEMLDVRKPFISLSLPGDLHPSLFDLLSLSSCLPMTAGRKASSRNLSGMSAASKFTLFLLAPRNYLSGDFALNPSVGRFFICQNLATSSLRRFTSEKREQSHLYHNLRQLMTLRIMANSPSWVRGRQILMWFSRRSGLIQAKTSFCALKKIMFSLMMKYPQQLASPQQAVTMVLAMEYPFQRLLNSFSRVMGSFLSSSIHIYCVLFSYLPRISLGTPSMCRSSRLLQPQSSFQSLICTRWQIFQFTLINKLIVETSKHRLYRKGRWTVFIRIVATN